MAYSAKILCDSVHSETDVRLTTMEVTLPRIVLAELNTHRVFSRNSASSRAIPIAKMIERVQTDPFIPVWWGKNQKGMQAAEELDDIGKDAARFHWLEARDNAVLSVQNLQDIDVHKQIANRLLEPWLWHTVIITSTEWENFYALRTHRDAQPEFKKAADMMLDLYEQLAHRAQRLGPGEWHLPLVPDYAELWSVGYTALDVARISCARCARVSYLTHDGKRDPKADLELATRLSTSGHMSPFEHAARVQGNDIPDAMYGASNFSGNWLQYRKLLAGEAVFRGGST